MIDGSESEEHESDRRPLDAPVPAASPSESEATPQPHESNGRNEPPGEWVRPARLQHDRQEAIHRLALQRGSVEVTDLAGRFEVTTETIRRDLSELQREGRVRRVHGGAVPIERASHEPLLATRDMQHSEEKLRIAELATAEVPHKGSVLIDSGSTLQRLAEVFPTESEAHVITNSLVGALTLAQRGVATLTVLGGGVQTNTMAMVDGFTVEMIRELLVDVVFISCDGLSLRRGLTTPYRHESLVKRAMIESANRVIALVDHSKLGNSQLFPYADFDEIDVLITDGDADQDTVEGLRRLDVDVRIAH
jgi:DeoR family fructose operon transcriptional repressor